MEDIIRQLQQLKMNPANTPQTTTPSFTYNYNNTPLGVANSAPYMNNASRTKSDPEVNVRA